MGLGGVEALEGKGQGRVNFKSFHIVLNKKHENMVSPEKIWILGKQNKP